jgi:hypothetical protein
MHGRLRVDVPKRNQAIGLCDDIGRNFSVDNHRKD